MKRYIQFLTIVLSAAALVACSEKEESPELAGVREIKFSAGIGNFQAKATDTAFEKDDAIGLFADEPVSVSNARLTWDGSAMNPDATIYWDAEQDVNTPVAFYAYYPFAEKTETEFTFTVPADQSVAANFAAADLMLASTVAAPADETVRLNFYHANARIVFTVVENNLDSKIESVEVSGVCLSQDVYITEPYLSATGEEGTIKAAPVVMDGVASWAVILPEQYCEVLKLSINLEDGSVVELPSEGVSLKLGRSYLAEITLNKASSSLGFSASVSDWLDGYLYFGNSQDDPGILEHSWYVEYNEELLEMEPVDKNVWHLELSTGRRYSEFRLVKDNYSEVWGSAVAYYEPQLLEEGQTVEYLLAPNGYIYLDCATGVFDLVLDMNEQKLYVTAVGMWEYLGTGDYIDGLVTDYFGFPHVDIPVDVYQYKNSNMLVYRVADPFKNWVFRDYFEYYDGGEIYFFVNEDGSAWISAPDFGLYDSEYGYFSGGSLVPENGSDYSVYGEYYERFGFMQFGGYQSCNGSDFGVFLGNAKRMMSLTLPGFERPVQFYDFENVYYDNYINDDGEKIIRVKLTTGMDVAKLKYGVYAGTLSQEECVGFNRDGLLFTEVIPEGTELLANTHFIPDYDRIIGVPVPGSGTYTLIWAVEDAAGNLVNYEYSPYSVLFDGDEAPEASVDIEVEPAQPLSDIEALAHVNFKDPAEIKVLVLEESLFQDGAITDDDVWDYTMTYGEDKSVWQMNSQTGADYLFFGLEPETNYRVVVAGSNKFGNPAMVQANVTTEASPEYTSLGIGHYTDQFFGDYTTEVEVLMAETEPVRYHVVDPYKELWENNEDEEMEQGEYTNAIDCFVQEDKLYYSPYLTGYIEPGYGPVRYYCFAPKNLRLHYPANCVLQEGVFNFAPYAILEGTTYYYPYNNEIGAIYLELPGYTYAPETEATPSPSRRSVHTNKLANAEAVSGMAVHKEIRPFTRHMIKTGAPKITPLEVTRNENPVEPIM